MSTQIPKLGFTIVWFEYWKDISLYVGLARAVPPNNTNFQLTFLLTRLQEALYEDLPVQSIKLEVYYHVCGLCFMALTGILT